MRLLTMILVGAYVLLNLALGVVGALGPEGANPLRVSLATRLPAAVLFLLAAACLAVGLVSHSSRWVAAGLVLSSVAPFVYGAMVEHSNVLLHHAVRAAVGAVIMGLWVMAWSAESD